MTTTTIIASPSTDLVRVLVQLVNGAVTLALTVAAFTLIAG